MFQHQIEKADQLFLEFRDISWQIMLGSQSEKAEQILKKQGYPTIRTGQMLTVREASREDIIRILQAAGVRVNPKWIRGVPLTQN